MLVRRCPIVGAVAMALGLAAPAGSLGAATPATPYDAVVVPAPDSELRARWGESMTAAGDLNGDGRRDLLVATTFLDSGGVVNSGRVYVLSGLTRQVIYAINSPEPQANAGFGAFLSAIGDTTGDGRSELLIGTDAQDVGTNCGAPEPNACNEDQGKAWVFNGANGNLLFALDNPAPQGTTSNRARFGSRLGTAGDVTGDGRPDPFVGASHNDQPAGCGSQIPIPAGCRVDEGQAFIFNGVTGALVRTLNFPAEDRYPAGGTCTGSCGWFGHSVQTPGDVNGDGVNDQLVGAGSVAYYTGTGGLCGTLEPNGCNELQGRLYLYSGATGQLLRKIDSPSPDPNTVFGFQDVAPFSPGDVNRDGRADVYGATSEEGEFEGEGFVFSGSTGAFLYPIRFPAPQVGKQGWSMTRTDYNGDAVPDIYVGTASSSSLPQDQNGGTYVYDGRNGALLKALELPEADRQTGVAGNTGPFLGWAVADLGDVNGDGGSDYAAAAAPMDEGSVIDAGRVYFFLSRVPPAPPPPPTYPGPIPAAAPFASCPAQAANVIRGSAASNSIVGTVRGDRIFAGTGNDVVDGLSGDDCIDLGPGTDRGQGGSGNDLVLGGQGADRIAGSAGVDRLLGGPSGDRMNGGFGNDRLHGQAGGDRIEGSRGRDRVNGGSSNDVISAGSSGDRVAGDQGNDRINGNSGNDTLRGNSGHDRLTGSTGSDRIAGDSGNDRINARDGRGDRVSCGRGRDRVVADRLDRVARSCERVRRSRR